MLPLVKHRAHEDHHPGQVQGCAISSYWRAVTHLREEGGDSEPHFQDDYPHPEPALGCEIQEVVRLGAIFADRLLRHTRGRANHAAEEYELLGPECDQEVREVVVAFGP